jgi:NAD+ synthase (glutamine-hydrolysing)
MKSIRIALCQINPTVGCIAENTAKIIRHIENVDSFKPDIIAFPELAVTGYPPEDLLYNKRFIADNIDSIESILSHVEESIVVVGFVDGKEDLYNAAAIIHRGKVIDVYRKIHLPNYGVFDEMRYFKQGNRYPIYTAGDFSFGINICEDIWIPEGPAAVQALHGAALIININASPYHIDKSGERCEMLSSRARDNGLIIAYLNITGGQDELVFDGHSLIINEKGNLIAEGKRFEEEDIVVDIKISDFPPRSLFQDSNYKLPTGSIEHIRIDRKIDQHKKSELASSLSKSCSSPSAQLSDSDEFIYKALVAGTRDYVTKNGFRKVCIGLSGGIDSSLVAAVAVDAIGKENVVGIFMPSPYTSDDSRTDAYALAQNLGIRILEAPIEHVIEAYREALGSEFEKLPAGIAEENIQARIRGNILMGFSNKFGWLVLTTGNKSEMSVGYATLYGDMAGGFAPIKDVPKTLVYRLCKCRNTCAETEIIPARVLVKEPTAELKPDQKDTDSLPPYDILDPILKAYIEEYKGYDEIVNLGFEAQDVKKAIKLVDNSEYKRRQSPPGIKITRMAFGRDRRFPITNKYRSC